MDLDTYLTRIGLKERPAVSAAGLAAIQRGQRLRIPFENLDIPLGRGISLEPSSVFDKLVTQRRGGYCFEQNALFGRALAALGFECRPLLARVWLFAGDDIPPRTHTLNLVTLAGEPWIADAGFGASYAPPMPLKDGATAIGEDGVEHRLVARADHGWMLERKKGDAYAPQYGFTLEKVAPVDLKMSNHWTSTWHESRFTQNNIASIVLPCGIASLQNRSYTRHEGNVTEAREVRTAQEMQSLLRDVFSITLSLKEIDLLKLF